MNKELKLKAQAIAYSDNSPEEKESLILELIEAGKKQGIEEEREKIKNVVDGVKESIYQLEAQNILMYGGEKLDLITKYQAVNVINFSGLPYTSISDKGKNE